MALSCWWRIDQLMKLGASVNTWDRLGRTPLILAANQGHVDCVESLIHSWGADVNATTWTDVEVCRTALACAAEKGYHQCTDTLIQAGADVNATVNSKPLMLATVASQCESMRKLIKAGADVNATGEDGVTCLLVACRHGYTECVELLIQQGADVNISDKEQNSPLIFTVAYWVNDNTLPCLKLLFRAGAYVNRIDNCGKNALTVHFTGSKKVNRRAVLLLLAAGETLEVRKTDSLPLSWDWNYSDVEIPDHILYKTTHLELKHMCRETIRDHLLELSPENLFTRVPGLGLPSVLTSCIIDVPLDL